MTTVSALRVGLPAPSHLLGHPQFTGWYPGQEKALLEILDWLNGPERFLCVNAPTGSGKSLLAVLSAHLGSRRAAILTVTKGLEKQLEGDFRRVGMVDIEGQSNYPCREQQEKASIGVMADQGPCHARYFCRYKYGGCDYYDTLRSAKRSGLLVTNYAYYLNQVGHSDGVGARDLLVCDEAHLAFQALEGFLRITVRESDLKPLEIPLPAGFVDWDEWRVWARKWRHLPEKMLERAQGEAEGYKVKGQKPPHDLVTRLRHYRTMTDNMSEIGSSRDRWMWQDLTGGQGRNSGWRWQLTPVWPGLSAQKALYRHTPKVLLMSATMVEKTADIMGVPAESRRWLSVPSYFPAKNSPIAHYKTVRMNTRTSELELRQWVRHIDHLIGKRLGKKGIVFTVSYNRRELLRSQSQYSSYMVTHETRDVFEVVERFKKMPAPAILVSPTVTSGWDFPGAACEWAIIGKIPYPDSRDIVVKERLKDDPDWTSYLAMVTLEQEVGRGTRSVADKCEYWIVDDNWTWFRHRFSRFSSPWFQQRIMGQSYSVAPEPLV